MIKFYLSRIGFSAAMLILTCYASAQTSFKPKYNNSAFYTGIEVGSKGVKLSIVEIGRDAQAQGAFNILKDSSVNTDFISFTPATFSATLDGLQSLYNTAVNKYDMPPSNIYTVISSGVKTIAEKDSKMAWIDKLIDSFRIKVKEPQRKVEVISVEDEARLSHLGIVPDSRRYNTFIIDIGSGNTKGGFFPYGNNKNFKLFQVGWGTKSTANAAEKRLADDNTLSNYNKQLFKVLAGAENSEIIYAVNESGSYPLSDNIAFSGGIAWATATLIRPEMIDNAVVSITYEEMAKFCDKLLLNHSALSDDVLLMGIKENTKNKAAFAKEIKRVHSVFDQRSLMAGAGLLLKIMRQFASAYETKQFYLVKNGQVGWISAYVDKSVDK
jgi:hypothetical protein